jgi:hypothetical protein
MYRKMIPQPAQPKKNKNIKKFILHPKRLHECPQKLFLGTTSFADVYDYMKNFQDIGSAQE